MRDVDDRWRWRWWRYWTRMTTIGNYINMRALVSSISTFRDPTDLLLRKCAPPFINRSGRDMVGLGMRDALGRASRVSALTLFLHPRPQLLMLRTSCWRNSQRNLPSFYISRWGKTGDETSSCNSPERMAFDARWCTSATVAVSNNGRKRSKHFRALGLLTHPWTLLRWSCDEIIYKKISI